MRGIRWSGILMSIVLLMTVLELQTLAAEPEESSDLTGSAGEVTVTFDVNGGESAAELMPVTVSPGETVVLPDSGLSKGTWQLTGWASRKQADRPDYRGTFAPTESLTLYAVYAPEFYTVSYLVNGVRTTESVRPGEKPKNIPQNAVIWMDASGVEVHPAQIEIWSDQTFTARADSPVAGTPSVDVPSAGATQLRLNTDSHAKFMSGSGDGCFWPDAPLSRGSAALILYNLLEEKPKSSRIFSDVPADAWCAQAAGVLVDLGLLTGYEDGTFRPSEPITRAVFAGMVSPFLSADTGRKTFPDVPMDHWAYDAIGVAATRNLLAADESGNFRPEGTMSRADGAVAFIRLLRHYPDVDAIYANKSLRIFLDVPRTHWAYYYIMEATTTHTVETGPDGNERWIDSTPDTLSLSDGYHRINGWLYRVQDGRFLYHTDVDGFTYDVDGRYTTGNAELDQRLNAIVEEQTDNSMDQDQKLRALFDYVRDNYTYLSRPHVTKEQTGWEAEYALEFLQKGKGNCFSFAAGYYSLVKELGMDANTVVGIVGSVNRRPHGWVEIRLDDTNYVFDTELEMAYRRKGNYSYNLFKKTYSTLPFYYEK